MKFTKLIDDIHRIQQETDAIYIYGAGFYGKDVCRVLRNNDIEPAGFLVTKKADNADEVLGLPVCEAEEYLQKNIGIVIGLSITYTEQVKKYLKVAGFPNIHLVDGSKYFIDASNRAELRTADVLEITTVLGCAVHCRYCPQDLLTEKYYLNDKHRQRVMTLENFQTILDHTPKECIMDFCGMAEPLQNMDCLEMIRMACRAGRKVYLYTTLSNVSEDTVDELMKLPLCNLTLHVADEKGYAHISKTETYYRNIETVVRAKKPDGRPFVDFYNAQTEPDSRIRDILPQKGHEVMVSLHDRAGNIQDETTQHRKTFIPVGVKMDCNLCGRMLSNNVVLPDGTLLLCCMDYGMQHVLGNLYMENYYAIRSKGELQRILRGYDGGKEDNILCRKCLMARVSDEKISGGGRWSCKNIFCKNINVRYIHLKRKRR